MTRTAELDDATWAVLEPLLPSSDGRPGRPFRDRRQVVEGIVHRYRAGLAWRDLPERFGPWQTIWKRHHRYSPDGTWDKVLTVLQSRADAGGGAGLDGQHRLDRHPGPPARRHVAEV